MADGQVREAIDRLHSLLETQGDFADLHTRLADLYGKRKNDDLMWWALLTPVYWMMMSYSGWRAVIQFLRDPFVWEKTQHGLVKKN